MKLINNNQRKVVPNNSDAARSLVKKNEKQQRPIRKKRGFLRAKPTWNVYQPEKLHYDDNVWEELGHQIGDFSLEERIGEGGFGSVYHGKDNVTGASVAIKVLPNLYRFTSNEGDAAVQRMSEMESSILRDHGHHPNIIGYHRTIVTRRNIYIVMQKATVDLATLLDYEVFQEETGRGLGIRKQRDFRQQIMLGILSAVKYLHEHGIAHCDLKPANILLVTDALDENLELIPGRRVKASDVRICDFGLAQTSRAYGGKRSRGFARKHNVWLDYISGTRAYEDPQMSRSLANGLCYEARRADMWSVGCILLMLGFLEDWQMIQYSHPRASWRRPFWLAKSRRLEENCKVVGITGNEAMAFRSLLEQLLQVRPSFRASSERAMKNSWFSQQWGVDEEVSESCDALSK